jgi:hypothetical protein
VNVFAEMSFEGTDTCMHIVSTMYECDLILTAATEADHYTTRRF